MVNIDNIITVLHGMTTQNIHLSPYGNDTGGGTLVKEIECDMEKRAAAFDLQRITDAIHEIPQHFKPQRQYSKSSSYALKHHLEEKTCNYITNGDFIMAMVLSGYRYKFQKYSRNRPGVNCVFNCRTVSK
jgi:hypothetical protein